MQLYYLEDYDFFIEEDSLEAFVKALDGGLRKIIVVCLEAVSDLLNSEQYLAKLKSGSGIIVTYISHISVLETIKKIQLPYKLTRPRIASEDIKSELLKYKEWLNELLEKTPLGLITTLGYTIKTVENPLIGAGNFKEPISYKEVYTIGSQLVVDKEGKPLRLQFYGKKECLAARQELLALLVISCKNYIKLCQSYLKDEVYKSPEFMEDYTDRYAYFKSVGRDIQIIYDEDYKSIECEFMSEAFLLEATSEGYEKYIQKAITKAKKVLLDLSNVFVIKAYLAQN